MDLGIKDKVALVTASSRGLGFASAEALAREGAVVHLCSRDKDRIEAAAARLRAVGGQVHAHVADLDHAEGIQDLVDRVQGLSQRIDILVANNGGPAAGLFLDKGDADWQAAIERSFMSMVRLARAVGPGMRGRRWGRIAFIASVSVKQPIPNLLLGNAARAAVASLSKTLAGEWGPDNVLLNVLCPGMIRTQRIEELYGAEAAAKAVSFEAVLEGKAAAVPLRRLGRPEEFGRVVAFFCSEAVSYVTGTVLTVDGGMAQGLL